MKIAKSDLAKIVAQASSLSERFSVESFAVNDTDTQESQHHPRLDRWCQVVAQGNWEKFAKRLIWDDLNLKQADKIVRALPPIDPEVLPTWAETLHEIIQAAWLFANDPEKRAEIFACDLKDRHNFASEDEYNYPAINQIDRLPLDPGIKLPFKEVLLPAISVARQKLLNSLNYPTSLPLELLSHSAYFTLERNLLNQLLNLSGKTLEYEFARSRPLGQNLLNLLRQSTGDRAQIKVQYDAFIHKLLQDGMLSFFQNYPVLGRLIATAIDFWVEATAKFLHRLQTNLNDIQQVFQPENNSFYKLGKIIKIKPALSDPHNSGDSVIAFTFQSGLQLVYKPKGLGAEVAYTQFLEWCNQQGIALPFKVLKVCDYQTHGWVEYVEHLPCEDEAAAQRFYQRAGMLLCLLYALRVVDCHRENLIAHGEHLVLIDMETIMHQEANPLTQLQEETEAETTVNFHFADSVLRTGLLPRWEFGKNKRLAYDTSALGSIEAQVTAPPEEQGETKDLQFSIPPNIPILNNFPLSPNDYLSEIITGFEQMYQFLIEKREILLAPDTPLLLMKNQRVRFIFRATKIYWTILQKTFAPQFLRDGIDRSIELDILARAFLVANQKPNAWSIFHAELKAMEQMDIPYFAAYPDSQDLTIGLEQPIEQYFKKSSYHEVISQLQNLNETNLAQQIEIIKGSFYARVVRNNLSNNPIITNLSTLVPTDLSQLYPLTKKQLIQEATRIAKEIEQRAIWGKDGSVKWISFAYIPNVEIFQLMPLPEDLYNGNGGIALFLSALDYVRGTQQFHELSLAAFQSIQKFLQTADFESTRRFVRLGIGGGTGLGSMIYALVKSSHFLQEPTLLENALAIAQLITPELITTDKQFDIIGGAAGAILGLLALYAATKEPKVLATAINCGQHLLAHQTEPIKQFYSPNLPIQNLKSGKAWNILGQKYYTGFSHGAAGIAYALLRLYAVTQTEAFLTAATDGITYEHSVFSPTVSNWPDFRAFAQQNGQPGFMVSWCHGATGIGLARLGGLSVLKTNQIEQDIEIALQTTQKYSLQDVDCVCCGNFGRIELLQVAAEKLSRPDLKEIAEQRTTWAVNWAEKSGGYKLPNLPNSVFSPSFFQGTSGIGYELLRLAYPELLPSVLLWD
ncbi:type 2 lantipeptide synthetase LanM family protein [Phormidium sp. LEGE 05292]|uniref:type 2 lanthipeptide synthetase LanM family protein n=1 Tax=[Phormidium] sp. LEGE 05292 TaxID=767427 RepID=UPI00187FB9CC|nr:type 2 lanthipeptide synthetase LanM family protein [Phormidium sp. LEGE 05292]MBE9224926.1 type 2 lantipeptide synthetase LanM family protein [Phormidium sp. LEGE 05292]